MTENKIRIVEVGPRDGLQNEKKSIPLDLKVSFVEKLFAAGLEEVELTSFVRSDKIPQLSDAKELTQEIARKGLLGKCWVLVPNRKGVEIAQELGITNYAFFTSASEAFNQKNINCDVNESLQRIKEALSVLKGSNARLRGYLSMVFGCPYEGDMPVGKSLRITQELIQLGIQEISLGDTIGVAGPTQVQNYINMFKKHIPLDKLAMHFHDTKGMALVNIYQSINLGIAAFDSSSAGLGGCPYAKGATGNVATEDVLYLLNLLGLNSGVNLKKLVDASLDILNFLSKHSSSKVHEFMIKEKINEKK